MALRLAGRFQPAAFLCLGALAGLAGCGAPDRVGKTVPVVGKIIVNGETLTTGIVSFWPDASLGNKFDMQAIGNIDDQGTFVLSTLGKEGAPPGWYKVVVLARENITVPGGRTPAPLGKYLVPMKYADVQTTDLSIEVVENPPDNAYHLELKR